MWAFRWTPYPLGKCCVCNFVLCPNEQVLTRKMERYYVPSNIIQWTNVKWMLDAIPTLTRHWGNASCFLWYPFLFHFTPRGLLRWHVRFSCGSKLKGTGFESPAGLDVCHRCCAYPVLQAVQRHGVCSAVYDTAHYKETLMSFDDTIFPWLCRKRRKAIFTHSTASRRVINRNNPLGSRCSR